MGWGTAWPGVSPSCGVSTLEASLSALDLPALAEDGAPDSPFGKQPRGREAKVKASLWGAVNRKIRGLEAQREGKGLGHRASQNV